MLIAIDGLGVGAWYDPLASRVRYYPGSSPIRANHSKSPP
jgi:hypothetical protein